MPILCVYANCKLDAFWGDTKLSNEKYNNLENRLGKANWDKNELSM